MLYSKRSKIPDEIERVALLGWHVYPASQYSRAACFPGASDSASCDLDTIAEWRRQFPRCNWRVVFGPSRLWALDCDVPRDGDDGHQSDGVAAFASIVARHSPLPSGPRMRSGGGGLGVFFRWNGEPIRGQTGYPAPGIDPRRGRLSQTIPPSIHLATKLPYRWIVAPWEVSPPDAPRWLLDLMAPPPLPEPKPAPELRGEGAARKYALAAARHAIERVATAARNTSNSTLNTETYSLARFVATGALTETEITECMLAAARARNIPMREAIATIRSGLRRR